MAEVIREGKEWKEKLIAFGDRVFGDDVQPGGFAALLPRVYGKDAECDNNHLIVVEDGEIQAMLLAEPTTMICGEEELKGVGIGTVSVSETARGKGYMQLLLKTVRDWMKEEDYAFAVLGGQRQRYGYWGYEPAGIRFKAWISKPNVKHALGEDVTGGLENSLALEPMTEGSVEEKLSYELYKEQPVRYLRAPETFASHLHANRHNPYVIKKDGVFAGYLSASFRKGKTVLTELVLKDEQLYSAVLKLFWKEMAPEGFELTLPMYQWERINVLEKLAEVYWLGDDHRYYVADLEKVLQFSMKVKQTTCGLKDGEWKFATEKGVYCCTVAGDEVKVTLDAECAGQKYDEKMAGEQPVKRTESEMVRLLFGPGFAAAWDISDVPSGWLPFPLCLTEIDAV